MSDVLIKDVPEVVVAEIDRRADEQGISRSEFLRRWLIEGMRQVFSVTPLDFSRLSELAADLADPVIIRSAWS